MKKDYTHIIFILDRSGSMMGVWNDVKGGYAEFVKQNKEAKGKCTFSLTAFDTEYLVVNSVVPINEVSEQLEVYPRGGTALYDAVGRTIVEQGEKLAALPEDERPDKVLCVIQTDGYENSSQEYNGPALQQLITEQKDKYNWDFNFVGAGEDCLDKNIVAAVGLQNVSAYNAANSGATFDTLAAKSVMYRSVDASDWAAKAQTVAFSDAERSVLNAEN